MKVGVPTEIKPDEYRVAITPAGVREMAEHGHEVLIQSGAGEGSAIADADYEAQGARTVPDAEAVWGEAELVMKVKEPQEPEVGAAARRADAVHLPAPGPRARAHEGPVRLGRHVRGLRDGRGRPRAAAAPRAHERGGGAHRHPGGRLHARAAARRPGHPPRRRARRARSHRARHRWGRRGHARRLHRHRHGGGGLRLRPLARPPAGARPRLRRAGLDRVLLAPRRGGDAAPRRPRDRRRARARGAGAPRGAAQPARAHEGARRARGRLHRPGRVLRDLAAHHALRPHLRGRRRDPLLRDEHAGRGAHHLDVRAHERHAALRAGARRPRGGGGRSPPCRGWLRA